MAFFYHFQTAATQTPIDLRSSILPLPKSMFKSSRSQPYLAPLPVIPPPTPTSMMIQHVLQNALSTDSVDAKHYLPPRESENSWKSYIFAFGMTLLDQVMKFPWNKKSCYNSDTCPVNCFVKVFCPSLMFKILFCPIGLPYFSNFEAIKFHNVASRSINSYWPSWAQYCLDLKLLAFCHCAC